MNAKTLAATTAIGLAAALAAPGATAVSTGNLAQDVQSALGSGSHVDVNVSGGTATLTGYVDSELTARAIHRVLREHEEIDNVIDLTDHH